LSKNHKYQKAGINLGWSAEPVYEWELRKQDNKDGGDVIQDIHCALYSVKAKDFVVYCKRGGDVINLAWLSDCFHGIRPPTKAQTKKVAGWAAKIAPFVL